MKINARESCLKEVLSRLKSGFLRKWIKERENQEDYNCIKKETGLELLKFVSLPLQY